MSRSGVGWTCQPTSLAAGENVSPRSASGGSATDPVRAARAVFPPQEIAQVKAVACEPPSQGASLSRRSCADIHRLVVERGICQASAPTIARWLREDAIRPWRYRSWIFPTDPDFLAKATPVLDLYQGWFEGRLLHPGDLVISADEKPSIQARARIHAPLPPREGSQPARRAHLRADGGAHLPGRLGRAPRQGLRPVRGEGRDRAVRSARLQVMTKEPYASARTVYWIVDNGSSHRGQASVRRLESRWPNLRLIHLPLHASRLNQVEIYFSIVQRKLLQPNDFASTAELARALNQFERHYNRIAEPFDWNFTRDDLAQLIARLVEHDPALQLAA